MNPEQRIVVTGAAGLVGLNLLLMLAERGYRRLIALDKHVGNLDILRRLGFPQRRSKRLTSAVPANGSGTWVPTLSSWCFTRRSRTQVPNRSCATNVTATCCLLDAIRARGARFVVHISSSVVLSVAADDYTRTKRTQEGLVRTSGLPHCILRPTLMFGWFDPKHFGWLLRFMARTPVFPIPGDGRFMLLPLYTRDFCSAICWCIEHEPADQIYSIVGSERIDYVDIIRQIKAARGLRTRIVHIPYWVFYALLWLYGLFSSNPPFTASQLKALSAGDDFTGVDTERVFSIRQTHLRMRSARRSAIPGTAAWWWSDDRRRWPGCGATGPASGARSRSRRRPDGAGSGI
jgi:nucleoside-diphosphate-sugar epimerase